MLMMTPTLGSYGVPANQAAINSATGRAQAMQMQDMAAIMSDRTLATYSANTPMSQPVIPGYTVNAPGSIPGIFSGLGASPFGVDVFQINQAGSSVAAQQPPMPMMPPMAPPVDSGPNYLLWGGLAVGAFFLWRHFKS